MRSDRSSNLATNIVVTLGLVAATVLSGVVLESSSAAPFAATSSSTPQVQYVGDSTGTTFTFTIVNTGTVDSIGAVEIGRPSRLWTITDCPSAPTGWTAQRADTMCRYRSAVGTADDIAPGASSSAFQVRASVAPSAKDIVGTWSVKVSKASTFDKNSKLIAAASTPPGLNLTAHSFEILDAVVDPDEVSPGDPCPAASKSATAGSTGHTLVICGRNRTTGTLTPTAAHSSLGGSFIGSPGTFSSDAVAPTATSVVLGSWSDVTITGTAGTDKTVIAKIGSAADRTSPLTTLEEYVATPAGANDPPVGVNDQFTTSEDSDLTTGDVLANDTDADGDPLSVSAFNSSGTQGTVTDNGDGTFDYDPNGQFDDLAPGEHQDDTFSYTVSDGTTTDTATVTIRVTGVDDAPVAVDDTATVLQDDDAAAIDVLANDTDVDGGPKTISSAGDPTHGTVVLTGGSAGARTGLTYEPDAGYCNTGGAPDTFSYALNGGSSATVSVTVTCPAANTPPVANDDDGTGFTTGEGSSFTTGDVRANDTDADGDPLTVSAFDDTGTQGTVTDNGNGTFGYDPNGQFESLDSGESTTDTFTYTVSDGTDTDTATVTITINGANDAPDAVNDAQTVSEDSTGEIVDVLANDTDVDLETLTVSALNIGGTTGTVTNNGTNVTYDPNGAFEHLGAGETAQTTFTYTASDGTASDTATVTITITGVDEANVAPDAVDDAATRGENSSAAAVDVLANDTDADADPLQITAVGTGGTFGTVAITGGGTGLTYNPNGMFEGLDTGESAQDTFTYTITDGRGGEDTATVTITVTGVNDAPDAVNDAQTVSEDSTGEIVDVLANDTDVDLETLTVTTINTTGTLGQVINNGTNVTYDPNGAFEHLGADETAQTTFTYTASDGTASDTATVTITITGANEANVAPDAVDDAATRGENSSAAAVDVLANDTDANADTLTITTVNTAGTFGTVAITGGGTGLTYNPNGMFEGLDTGESAQDTFTYTITDGALTDTATVTITVTGVNDAPEAVNDAQGFGEDSDGGIVDVLANDTDVDLETLTVSAIDTTGTLGQVVNNGTNVTYDPNGAFDDLAAGATTTTTFTYSASDGTASDTATVTITITGADDGPVAVADSATVLEDAAPTAVNVLTNDTDVDGGPKTIASASDPANGAVVLTGGTAGAHTGLTYAPDAGYCGPDSFTYTLNGGSSATVSMTVTCVNDAPVIAGIEAGSLAYDENGPATAITATGTVADSDSANFAGGTLTVDFSAGGQAEDRLEIDNQGTGVGQIGFSGGNVSFEGVLMGTATGGVGTTPLVITLNTAATPAAVQALVRAITYRNVSDNPSTATRTVRFRVTDGDGGTSNAATRTVTVAASDDRPLAVNDSATVLEDAAATPVNVLANDSDVDGGTKVIASATQPANGIVVLTGGSAGAHTGLTYEPAPDYCNDPPGTTPDTFTYTLNGGTSATVSITVTCVDDVNAAPVIADLEAGSLTYVEGDAATPITETGTVSDTDSPDFSGGALTVDLSVGGSEGDELGIRSEGTGPGQINVVGSSVKVGLVTIGSWAYDEGTHTLVVSLTSADATVPVVQALLRSITYRNTSQDPSTDPRTARFVVTDGDGGTSAPATRDITVGDVDDAPVAVDDSATVLEDAAPTAVNVLANDTDIDGGTKAITSASDPANGTVVVTGGGTGLTFQPDANYCNAPPGTTLSTFTYTLNGGSTATVSVTVTCVDDNPVAVNDAATVLEDAAPTAVNVLANDTDIDGGTKAIASASDPANGTVVVTGGGTGLTFQPDANYCNAPPGTTPSTFTYTLNGGSTATVSVTVTCVDDNPVAVNDSATVLEDAGATAVNVLANDTDIDAGPKTIASATDPANGTVVVTGGGTGLTFQPDANYCNAPPGTTPSTFTYTLNGGSTATVSVTVTCVDDNPVAVNDAATVLEDAGATAVNVLANDTDIDAGPKTIASATDPANGTVVVTGGGTGLTFQPDANYCNAPPGTTPSTFTYTLNGGSTATVSVTVTCVDDNPVAVNDAATVLEDAGATAVNVLANDTDIDAGPKTIASASDPANGTVVVTGGGTGLTFQPDANYCNAPPGTTPSTFTYTLNGGSTATVSMTVTCVDDNPVAVNDSATVLEDSGATAVGVLTNDTDVDGGPKTIASATDPANGTVVLTGGTAGAHTGLTYQPAPDYCNNPPGTTPDTFTYTLNGGSTATVSVTVTCVDEVNVAPVIAALETGPLAYTENDAATPITATGTITDPDSANFAGGTLTAELSVAGAAEDRVEIRNQGNGVGQIGFSAGNVSYEGVLMGTAVGGVGTTPLVVTLNTAATPTAAQALLRNITYRNVSDNPSTATRTARFLVTDGDGGTSNTATRAIQVVPVDDRPVAVNDVAAVLEDAAPTAVNVLANDTDIDAGPKTIASASDPANGTVVVTGGGTGLTYQPDANYCNNPPGTTPDTFTYTLNGGSTATVSMTVTCVDDNPVAVNDSATVLEDAGATAVAVLTNDTDGDGGPKTIASASDPANGTVVLTGGTAGAHTGLTFQPDANYCNAPPGTTLSTFTYSLNGGSTATVSMTVTCVDDNPVAVNDAATVLEDAGATAVAVLTNDTDIDGGPKTIASASDPANGTVVVTGGGTGLTFQPDANYCNAPPGTTLSTFTYTLNGGSTATVSMTVTCVDDNPVAVNDAATVAQGAGATAVAVLTNDTDIDAGPKTITSASDPANGTVVITGGGTGLTYQPDAGYCNTPPGTTLSTFTYTLNGGSTATVSMTVTCQVNGAPNAVNDSITINENQFANAMQVLLNDTDPDGDPLTIISVTQPASGVSNHTATTASFDPGTAFDDLTVGESRVVTFTYTISDGNGGGDTATVTVTVVGVNDAPAISSLETSILVFTEGGAPVPITATGTVTDIDSDNFSTGTLTASLSVNGHADDRLAIRHQGTGAGQIGVSGANVSHSGVLIGTFTGGTGTTPLVVTLNVAATPAATQALLRNITFANVSENPTFATRTARFVLTDGDGGTSDPATRAVNAANANDNPVIANVETTPLPYTEHAPPVVVTQTATITDVDDTSFTFLSAELNPLVNSSDTLSIRNQGTGAGLIGVSGSTVTFGGVTIGTFSGGTAFTALSVTLNTNATVAATQALLRNITYQNTAGDVIAGNHGVRFMVGDGSGLSNQPTRTITVTPVNDPPFFSFIDSAPRTYVENNAAEVIVTAGHFLQDLDSANLSGGNVTVALTAGGVPEDRLEIRDGGTAAGQIGVSGANVTYGGVLVGTFTGGTSGTTPLVVSLNAAATPTVADRIVKSITFRTIGEAPSTAPRTARVTVNDGDGGINGGTSLPLDKQINVIATNDAPVIAAVEATPLAYVESATLAATAVVITATGTVTDVDSADFSGGTLTVDYSAGEQNEDRLAIRNQGSGAGQIGVVTSNVTYGGTTIGNFTGGAGVNPLVVNLTPSATAVAVQALVRNITYANNSQTPITAARTARFVLMDGDGGISTPATRSITVTPTNDPPVVSGIQGTAHVYVEGDPALVIGPNALVGDPDSTNFDTGNMTVDYSVGGGAEDLLQIRNQGIAAGQIGTTGSTVLYGNVPFGTFVGGVGTTPLVITLNASATHAATQALARNITYRNVSDTPAASRTVEFALSDGDGATDAGEIRQITVTAVDDAPVVATSPGSLAHTEGEAAEAIDALVAVTDIDSANLTGASVSITGNFATGQDVLALPAQPSITSTFDAVNGVLTLTGTTTVANYQAALRAVTYRNTSEAPSTLARTVSFVAVSGSAASNPATKGITVTAVADAPVLTASGGATAYTEQAPPVVIDAALNATDPDGGNPTGATVTIAPFVAGDTLHFATLGTITGSFGAGVLTLSGAGTLAEYQAALRTVQFSSTSDNPGPTRTIGFRITTPVASNTSNKTIAITEVNDPPVVNLDAPGGLTYAEQAPFTNAFGPAATIVDPDSATLSSLTVTITAGLTGADSLRVNPAVVGFTSNYVAGVLTITRVGGTVAEFQNALRNVQFSNSSNDPDNRNDGTANPLDASRTLSVVTNDGAAGSTPRTRVVTILPVNDAPGAPSVLPSTTGVRNTTLVSGVTTTEPHVVRAAVPFIGNSADPDNLETAISLVPVASAATASGGVIAFDATGNLRYEPPASGTLTSDTYGYQLTDGTTASSPITFTVNLTGAVWYVADQSVVGANGTSVRPFATVAAALTAAPASQPIHIRRGTGDGIISGASVLAAGDRLLGEGVALTNVDVGTATVETLFPAGTRPVLTASAADVVTLASTTVIAGVDINPDGAGNGIFGTATTGVTLRSMSVIDTGVGATQPGIELTGAGNGITFSAPVSVTTTQAGALAITGSTLAGTVSSVSVSGTTTGPGINLTNTTGTLSIGAATITSNLQPGIVLNSAGTVVFASAGAVTVNSAGAKALDLSSTNLGASVFDSITVTGSGSGAVRLNSTTGSPSLGDGVGTDLSLATTSGSTAALDIASSSAVVIDAAGTDTISATSGPAADIRNSNGSQFFFDSLSSTNSASDGVNLETNLDSPFDADAGAISGAAGIGFDVQGGGIANSAVTYDGAINDGLGPLSVEVTGRSSSVVTFTGAISDSADLGGGISVTGNTAGTTVFSGTTKVLNTGASAAVTLSSNGPSGPTGHGVAFTNGGLDIDTTSGAGLVASIGGQLTVMGAGNTITSGTGTALSVTSTAFGPQDVTFQSITANGAASGIVLNATNPVGGTGTALKVTGTGAADSGGTINNTTGHGISLTETDGASFTNIRVQGAGRSGIQGVGVTGFSLINSTITGSGDSLSNDNDSSVAFNTTTGGQNNNVDGAVTITGNTLTNAFGGGVDIFNYAGTITNATISNNTVSSSFDPAASRRSGIALNLFGSATTVASLTTGTIANNTVTGFPSGDGIGIQGANTASSTAPAGTYGTPGGAAVTITGNQVIGDATNKINGFGIQASVTGRGQGNFAITNNGTVASPLRNMKSSAIAIGAAGDVTTYFTVTGNRISANNGFSTAGIALGTDKNIQADLSTLSNPQVRATISSNNIANTSGSGIRVLHRSSNGTANLRVENNTITNVLGNLAGIRVENGSSADPAFNPTMCANIANNAAASGPVDGFGDKNSGINLYKLSALATTYRFGIVGLAPSPANPSLTEVFVANLNPLSDAGEGFFDGEQVSVRTGDNFTSCTLPAGM